MFLLQPNSIGTVKINRQCLRQDGCKQIIPIGTQHMYETVLGQSFFKANFFFSFFFHMLFTFSSFKIYNFLKKVNNLSVHLQLSNGEVMFV